MYGYLKKITKSNFSKKVSTLFIANVLTHCISMLNIMIMARILKLEEIGLFQVFISYSTIAGSFVLLSYQIAIQTSNNSNFKPLVIASLPIAAGTSLIAGVILYVWHYEYYLAIVIIMFLSGINLIIDAINIRNQQINKLALRRLALPLLQTIVLFITYNGIINASADALIKASILSTFICTLLFAFTLIDVITKNSKVRLNEIVSVFKNRFKPSSLLSASDMLNAMAYNLPTIIINKYFGSALAGQYSIILKICNVPISLISDSIAKVYLGVIGNEFRTEDKLISHYNFIRLRNFMAVTALFILIAIITMLPSAINLILGENWSAAAIIGQILAPLFSLTYLVTPLSMALYILDKQILLFKLQISYFVISVMSFTIGAMLNDFFLSLWLFLILSVLRYIIIFVKINKIVLNYKRI